MYNIYIYIFIYTLIIYMGNSLHCLHVGGKYGAYSLRHCDRPNFSRISKS